MSGVGMLMVIGIQLYEKGWQRKVPLLLCFHVAIAVHFRLKAAKARQASPTPVANLAQIST